MKQPPFIIVQLVHIEGPLKGEIQDCPQPEITIGRHPSCDVRFPKDLAIISRQHARIVREGNRFKVVDQSANGTFLNGKAIKEAYLKDGDVLMFAEGGGKASFLTQTLAQAPEMPPPKAAPAPGPPLERPSAEPAPPMPSVPFSSPSRQPIAEAPQVQAPPPPSPPSSGPPPFGGGNASQQVPVGQTQKPLIIQYGPTLRSYNQLPVTIGQGGGCDFVLNHPAIFERHAQVFFYQGRYWIKDLSGRNPILINGRPMDREAALEPDCRLSLTSGGPDFRFLGDGRLAEIEPEVAESLTSPAAVQAPQHREGASPVQGFREIGKIVKRMIKK